MDTVSVDRSGERAVLKYAAAICLGLLFLVAYPTCMEVATRDDFIANRLETHRAEVLDVEYDSGFDGSTTWTSQKFTLRLDNDAQLTEPIYGAWIKAEKGGIVSAGLSHGRLVTVDGQYIRSGSVIVLVGLTFMAGAFVLSVVSAVQVRRTTPGRSDPYTSGYVTQALILYVLLTSVIDYGRYDAWEPVITLALATGIPLTIFWSRHRRPRPAPVMPRDKA
ncbi:hypothetical protein [Actinoplanes sp. NPDC020271]|uniref:hypothetical protein n=1 Tax=Actinoplanes sp. NPDC020271 TaxID=3363896 RepID=UPI0037A343E6